MEADVSFGNWIQKRRKALDLTQVELAKRAGCSVSALRKIEADERRPSKQLAGLLADSLEIPTEDKTKFIRIARGEMLLERLQLVVPLPNISQIHAPPHATPQTNLPGPPTPLVGREAELIALEQLLHDPECRLITLVGLGGIGKTRLAIQTGIDLLGEFTHGTFFVSLTAADNSDDLITATAQSLDFSFYGTDSPKDQLLNYLREKHMLLILDNCEHLIDCSIFLADILQHATQVKMLVTSREPLNLHGEWVFEVKGLAIPQTKKVQDFNSSSAVKLFLQRARQADYRYRLTASDRSHIARICQLMQGLPLGIELAASWMHTLSCREIAEEIERSLDFLTTSMRDIPERHRSLRAVFDHSWRMLTEQEQQVLSKLSVFRGGFDRQSAEQVAGGRLPLLSSLLSKSLLRRTEDGRYDLHELIRQYVAKHLEVNSKAYMSAKERHYSFYLALADEADCQIRGGSQLEYIGRLEQEYDNLRAALTWSLEAGGESALHLAVAMHWFWYIRGHYGEGDVWIKRGLELSPNKHSSAYARALNAAAMFASRKGDDAAAVAFAEESIAIFLKQEDISGLADAYTTMSIALEPIDSDKVHWYCEQALTFYREAGSPWNIARGLYNLGSVRVELGDRVSGRTLMEESASILEELEDRYILPFLLNALGTITHEVGYYDAAKSTLERGLTIAEDIHNPQVNGLLLVSLGRVLQSQGEYVAAHQKINEALQVYRLMEGVAEATALLALAENELARGSLSTARSYIQELATHPYAAQNSYIHVVGQWCQGLLAYYEGDVGRSLALLEGVRQATKGYRNKVREGWLLHALGLAVRMQGKLPRARVLFADSLSLFLEIGHKQGIATCLEGLAGIAALEDPEYAAILFGAADEIRQAIGAPLPAVDLSRYDNDISSVKMQLDQTELEGALAQGHTMPLEQIAEFALGSKLAGG